MSAPPITAAFSLVNHDGTPVTEASYRGQWQLVQFGFTSCKAVCPRALSKLTAALDTLAASAGPVPLTALYITVDPDRDSPEVMRNYLQTYPRFTGLTGPGDAIDDAKKAFKIFTRRRDAQDGYDVQHTAVTYLVDPDGQPAHYWADVRTAEEIAEDLERIVVTRTTPAEHDGPRGEQAPAASSCCAPAD